MILTSFLRRKDVKVKDYSTVRRYGDDKENIYFKFNRVPFLRHVADIYAGISGAFVAIRRDVKPGLIPITPFPEASLREELKIMLAGHTQEEISTDLDAIDKLFDVCFVFDGTQQKLYAHRAMLACISPFFSRLLKDAANSNEPIQFEDGEINLTISVTSPCRILVKGISVEAISLTLKLIYTAEYPSITESIISTANTSNEKKKMRGGSKASTRPSLRSEFFSLIRLLELHGFEGGSKGYDILKSSMLSCRHIGFADMILRMEDGDLYCHQFLLSARCPFFGAMLDSGSKWLLLKETLEDETFVVVQLMHLHSEPMNVVLNWIYGDANDPSLLFTPLAGVRSTLEAYIQFLVEILAISNELLIDHLKLLVSQVLGGFIEINNVTELLEVADFYEASALKEACLQFSKF
jgi:hypothetical protein